MKLITLSLLFTGALCAQTAVPTASTLPSQTIGAGTSWLRGNAYPASGDVNVGLRIGATSFYSWTTISTPIATTPAGSQPLPSSITTGAAWIAAQNATGSVSLVAIAQGGFTSISSTAGVSASISGSFGVAFRPWKAHVWIFPYVKAANPATGVGGAVATAILQPGVMLLYGFGGK